MKYIKQYRKIAILMDKTNYELWDVCDFLNAQKKYLMDANQENINFEDYSVYHTDLSVLQVRNLIQANQEMEENDEFSLAKEFAMMSNMIVSMDECDFGKYNPTIYEMANNYMDEVGDTIIMLYANSDDPIEMARYLDEVMNAGKGDEVIAKYMNENGYQIKE